MKFTKMHGLGNDYIYVNGFEENVDNKSELAIELSKSHFGIGSDGIIFINPSEVADCEMEMYNADGSRGEMCGNGVRCVAKYVYDNGIVESKTINVETLAGIKKIDVTVDEETNKVKSAKVDMGAPILEAEKVPCDPSCFKNNKSDDRYNNMIKSAELEVVTRKFKVTCVSMGNPHAIVYINEPVEEFLLDYWGPLFESHPAFPNRVNTEFVRVIDRNTVEMRVWERGSGETLACGTGATAVAVSSIINGYTGNEVTVKLLGGDLLIEWDGNENHSAFMTGPATKVFDGEVEI
ncbi:MAG: diaminopimelate epimerase [Lachnospiraceae bacterium]|nr:diaminopimelate epimerase [Lachnospiraceae bacterium]